MKNNRASWCRAALAAAAVVGVGAAFAAEYVWDGGAGDGKWSSAANWNPDGMPGLDDTVRFTSTSGSSTVDADFGGQVKTVKLETGFAGTVSLNRSLIIGYELNLVAGTFTCGENDLQFGDPAAADTSKYPGRFQQTGGTFSGPTGEATLYQKSPARAGCDWMVSGGKFNVASTTFSIWPYHDVNYTSSITIDGQTFKSVRLEDTKPGQKIGSYPRVTWIGTNTVTGAFMHRGGTIWSVGSKMWFNVHGDYYTGGNADGGPGVVCLCGAGDQQVIGDAKGRPSMSLWIDKPSGKVTFKGGKVNIGWGNGGTRGTRFISSTTVDMSELDTFEVGSDGGNCLFIYPNVNLIAPPNFIFRNKQWGVFNVRDQTFDNLTFLCEDYSVNWTNPCTNTINGTFFTDGYVTASKRPEFYNSDRAGAAFVNGDMILSNRVGNAGGFLPHIFTNGVDQTIRLCGGTRRPCLPAMFIRKEPGSRLSVVSDADEDVLQAGIVGGSYYGYSLLLESGIFDLTGFREVWLQNVNSPDVGQKGGELVDPGITWVLKSNCVNPAIGPFVQPIYGLRNELNAGISAKDALTITNSVVMCGGSNCRLGGSKTWNIQGDYIVSNCTTTGAQQTPITFSGDRVQVYSNANPRTETWGVVTVNKMGGKLVLASDFCVTNDATCNGGYENFYWTNGTIDLNGHDLCLGSYPHIWANARAVIPAGSHLRIKGNIKSPSTAVDVAAGATLAFELPAGAQDEPMVQVLTSVAQKDPFNLEVLPKVAVEAPRIWKVLSYGSNFTSFDAKKWSVTGPDEFRKPRVSHDTDNKLILLNWKYKTGLCLFVR